MSSELPHTWKSESEPTSRVARLANMTCSRADTVPACCNGLQLLRLRAVRQSLLAFECAYAKRRSNIAIYTKLLR